MADDEFTAVETSMYIRCSQYPKGMTKGEKANLRRKCKNNFKFETGMLCYKKDGIDEHQSGRFACDQTTKKGGYWSHAILE